MRCAEITADGGASYRDRYIIGCTALNSLKACAEPHE